MDVGKIRITICIGILCSIFFVLGLGLSYTINKESPITYPEPINPKLKPLPYVLPIQYAHWVIYYCDENQVPIFILCRLINHESGWNPNANRYQNSARYNIDGSRDLGLVQKDLEGFNDGQPIDPFDPETSIRVCARTLSATRECLGSWTAASISWNTGIGGYRAGRRPAAYIRIVEGEKKI
jgi:soluble lytic murein transglycosylase-like protein